MQKSLQKKEIQCFRFKLNDWRQPNLSANLSPFPFNRNGKILQLEQSGRYRQIINVCTSTYMSIREQLSKLMNEWTPKSDLLIKKGIVPYIMAFVG